MFIGSKCSLNDESEFSQGGFDTENPPDFNDDEQYLIGDSNLEFQSKDMYVQMNRSGNVSRKFMLKATLVTIPDRSVIVEVSETDTIGNLQVIIGENMKTAHTDVF